MAIIPIDSDKASSSVATPNRLLLKTRLGGYAQEPNVQNEILGKNCSVC